MGSDGPSPGRLVAFLTAVSALCLLGQVLLSPRTYRASVEEFCGKHHPGMMEPACIASHMRADPDVLPLSFFPPGASSRP
jgi:hypothetical protein